MLKPLKSPEKDSTLFSHDKVTASSANLDHFVKILDSGLEKLEKCPVDIRGTKRTPWHYVRTERVSPEGMTISPAVCPSIMSSKGWILFTLYDTRSCVSCQRRLHADVPTAPEGPYHGATAGIA